MAENTKDNAMLGAVEAAPDASVGPHIAETPVSSASYEPPPLPLEPGMTPKKVKVPLNITPTKLMLGAVIVCLILLIIMGGLTIYAITNGQVNVTISVPSNSAAATTPPPASTANGDTTGTTPTTQTDIYIYALALPADFPSGKVTLADLPVGSIPFGTDFIVPYLTTPKYTGSDLVQKALNDLLAMKAEQIPSTTLRTSLVSTDLTAEVVVDAAGAVKVNLKGTWPGSADQADVKAKEQIERTIQHYTYNYTVTLNGSSVAYGCIGSSAASCK